MRVENFHRTFRVADGTTLPEYSRVQVESDGTIVVAAGTDGAVGVCDRPAVSGEHVSVYMFSPSRQVIAAAAINIGDKVQGQAATGKYVVNAAGNHIALEAAQGDGEAIEITSID